MEYCNYYHRHIKVKNHLNFDSPTNIIFSHPIAGSDKSGISGVDDQLFINKKTIICNPYQVDESHLSKLKISRRCFINESRRDVSKRS